MYLSRLSKDQSYIATLHLYSNVVRIGKFVRKLFSTSLEELNLSIRETVPGKQCTEASFVTIIKISNNILFNTNKCTAIFV